jgi:hypothetical protein
MSLWESRAVTGDDSYFRLQADAGTQPADNLFSRAAGASISLIGQVARV